MRAAALAAAVLAVASTGSASAKNRIYWANLNGNSLAFANLDGSGGGILPTPGAAKLSPSGVAIWAAGGKIYWGNRGGCGTNQGISFANLDGSGGGTLNTGGATCSEPASIAIDPTHRRIYWANFGGQTGTIISFADLGGSGGHDLPSMSGNVNGPFGIAVDPAIGRLYWTNWANSTIAFANTDLSGGGFVNVGSAHVNGPTGIAVDTATNRAYWANFNDAPNTISFANLNGSLGGQINTTGTSISSPEGVAIDAANRRIYWGNRDSNTISFANLNGVSGGGNLRTTTPSGTPTTSGPVFPVILDVPLGVRPPAASGGNAVGSALSCTGGTWAGDNLPAFLYRAPRSFSFQWTLNGSPVTGANRAAITASAAGAWRCVVTASNAAGGTPQTSNAVAVFGDRDHDGILDPNDRCPTSPRGKFDRDNNGCPGPYRRLRLGSSGGWTISDRGVLVASMSATGLRRGSRLRFVCKPCHARQTFKAKRARIRLKRLSHRLLKRGQSFTLTATARGFIGQRLTLTVKRFGHTHRAFVRVSRAPFNVKRRCIPAGSRKPRKRCSATPPSGP